MIPENWESVPLKDIAIGINPGFPCGAHNKTDGMPHLRPMNINARGVISLEDLRFVNVENPPLLQAGDLLFNNTNSPVWVGKTALIKESDKYTFSNHMTRIRLNRDLAEPAFVAAYLHFLQQSNFFLSNCQNHVNQASISSTFLKEKVDVLLPPLAEQQRIVAKLDELMERLASARAKLERVPRLLSHFRRAVLSAACSGALTRDWREENDGSEDDWIQYEMRDLVKVSSGEAFKKSEYSETGARLLQIANVSFSRMKWEQQNFLPLSYLESHPQLALEEGEIVMALNRPLLDWKFKVARIQESDLPAILYQRVGRFHRIKNAPEFDWAYLFQFLQSWEFIQELNSKLRGSDQPYINPPEMLTTPISLPPLPEQIEIVARVNRLFALADSLEARFDKAHAFFERMSGALLAKAFRGELVPQNPDDESTAVTLERLRAQSSHGQDVAGVRGKVKAKTPRKARAKKSVKVEAALDLTLDL